jgi:hypothetical protein
MNRGCSRVGWWLGIAFGNELENHFPLGKK